MNLRELKHPARFGEPRTGIRYRNNILILSSAVFFNVFRIPLK